MKKVYLLFVVIAIFFSSATYSQKNPQILKLLSANEKLTIEALDGQATIADAKDVFKAYIDPDFIDWGFSQPGLATGETSLNVYEMTGEGTFVKIFTEITPDLDKIIMTQAQIIRFCEKYPNWLRQEGLATFFLTKKNNEYFVADVHVFSDGLGVRVYRLEDDRVWHGEARYRVVFPQLIPLVK